jgi:RNA polymerase sigma-70 factor (ECF subfamily)
MISDEDLIQKIKDGDDGAFQELTSRHIKHIFNFVFQYVRTKEDSEDVTQETFFKTWKYMRRFKDGMKFKPWLFTIARNTALDYIKKKKAITFSDMNTDADDDSMDFSETIADTGPSPTEIFARAELADEVSGIMDDLHPDHRNVLIMHYRYEMTFEEIADSMKKPMNTVKSWHRRSLARIKNKLLHHKTH